MRATQILCAVEQKRHAPVARLLTKRLPFIQQMIDSLHGLTKAAVYTLHRAMRVSQSTEIKVGRNAFRDTEGVTPVEHQNLFK